MEVDDEDWDDGSLKLWIQDIAVWNEGDEPVVTGGGRGLIDDHGKVKNSAFYGGHFETEKEMNSYLGSLPLLPDQHVPDHIKENLHRSDHGPVS